MALTRRYKKAMWQSQHGDTIPFTAVLWSRSFQYCGAASLDTIRHDIDGGANGTDDSLPDSIASTTTSLHVTPNMSLTEQQSTLSPSCSTVVNPTMGYTDISFPPMDSRYGPHLAAALEEVSKLECCHVEKDFIRIKHPKSLKAWTIKTPFGKPSGPVRRSCGLTFYAAYGAEPRNVSLVEAGDEIVQYDGSLAELYEDKTMGKLMFIYHPDDEHPREEDWRFSVIPDGEGSRMAESAGYGPLPFEICSLRNDTFEDTSVIHEGVSLDDCNIVRRY